MSTCAYRLCVRSLFKQGSAPPDLKMVAKSVYLPKHNDQKPQGEDAHFICADEQTIGIADGVGGWAKKGIDAGKYARELMSNAAMAVLNELKGFVNPKRILHEAFERTTSQGSSTACILTLNFGNILCAANVGDSGFMIIRDGTATYKSPVQQKRFNRPYQLGNRCDHPSLAEEIQVKVEEGDVLVVGTDGLFDNMHTKQIEDVIRQNKRNGIEPEKVACTIANLALYNSFDKYTDSPFSVAARRAGLTHRGGKVDDITVIVANMEQSKACGEETRKKFKMNKVSKSR